MTESQATSFLCAILRQYGFLKVFVTPVVSLLITEFIMGRQKKLRANSLLALIWLIIVCVTMVVTVFIPRREKR